VSRTGAFGFWPLSGCGAKGEEGVLWAVSFQKVVKDFSGKYGVVVIQMVVGYVFGKYVKPLDRV